MRKNKELKGIAKKMHNLRNSDIDKMLEPLGEALYGSAMAYTGGVVRAATKYIEDPTNAEKMAALILQISECYDQSRKSTEYIAKQNFPE